MTWQWQLDGDVDIDVDAEVYDIDLFETPADIVDLLHERNRKVICYVSTQYEEFRPDAGGFPEEILGNPIDDWPGERWVDIRRMDILSPIIAARMDQCRSKGFDGLEPDLLDGYLNSTGFPLTEADQLTFNRQIAALAHERGLSVALKNVPELAGNLVGDFDFVIDEQCAQYSECEAFVPFVQQGKAVFHVEYELDTPSFCPTTVPLGFSSMAKHVELDAWREPC